MRPIRILCVCGSGTATSAMLSAKLRDVLDELGYAAETDETNPPGVAIASTIHPWDLIAYTSPVEDTCGIPAFNATGFLVGIGEEEFLGQLKRLIKGLDLTD
ncbi:PTS system IIB component, Gat family [Coriobacterium glomerans PW2]|uniref:PTS system IIB component, Gat family n=2 Tax=Coriobacterium TaxID=33870 RepID=F2N8J4_CORGP|nr:PTS system IIB component, Gat family [Coriobacterium glomerans PW2]